MFGWDRAATALRLALEPRERVGIRGDGLGQNLDRDVPVELPVPRPVHLPHPARAERREDLVGAEARAGGKRHFRPSTMYRSDSVRL